MSILLLIVVLCLVLRLNLNRYRENSPTRLRWEKWSCYLVFAVMLVLTAFRGETVGTDTLDYISDYEEVGKLSLIDIFNQYENYWLFYAFSKIFADLGFPLWGWFGVVGLVYLSSIGRFIFRFSQDKLYSLLVFVALDLFLFSLAGLKQTMAMALMLHAFLFFIDRKYLLVPLFIGAAYLCHPTALFFIFAFILYPFREKKIFPILAFIIVAAIALGSLKLMSFLVALFEADHFDQYLDLESGYSARTLVLYVLVMLCSCIFGFKYLKKHGFERFECAMIALACALHYMALLSPSLFRLAYFYTPFFMTFLPNSFYSEKENAIRSVAKYCILAGLLLFLFVSRRDFVYSFAVL